MMIKVLSRFATCIFERPFLRMSVALRFLVILICFGASACSTPMKSRLAVTSVAAVIGAGIGSATAPKDERKELHAMYWAGILGLSSAVAGNFIFSEESEIEKARLETAKLKAELDLIQNSKTVLLKEGKGYFKNPSGEEFFQNGKAKWRLYQIDRWATDGPNRLYHQDRMVELIPVESEENP